MTATPTAPISRTQNGDHDDDLDQRHAALAAAGEGRCSELHDVSFHIDIKADAHAYERAPPCPVQRPQPLFESTHRESPLIGWSSRHRMAEFNCMMGIRIEKATKAITAAHEHDHHRLEQRRQRADAHVHLRLVAVG